MAAGKSGAVAATSEREIVLERVLDAPRERVWDAWASPERIGTWWGPNGFTTRTREFALRPGGSWRHVMVGPDGTESPNSTRFEEVVRPERIVYTNGGGRAGGPGASFRATATFEGLGDAEGIGARTRLTLRMVFDTPEERDLVVRDYGAIEGGKQTLARLAEMLAREESAGGEFVFERVLDAPRERVFRAWTDAEELARWWGPKMFTNPRCEADARPGGAIRIDMRGPDGVVYPMTGEFREVQSPERIVFVSAVPDADGRPIFEVLNAVRFAPDGGGGTRLTLRARVISRTPAASRYLAGMDEGWTQSLDRLAGHVRS